MMVAIIKKGNKVIATIMIEEIEFSKMNLYYENLFKVVSNLIESSIVKAYDYEKLTSKERYILQFSYYLKILLKYLWMILIYIEVLKLLFSSCLHNETNEDTHFEH